MKPRDSILLALPALVVGLGAGYWFASLLESSPGVEASAQPGLAGPSSPGARSASGPGASRLAPVETHRAAAEAAAPSAAPRASEAEIERALDAVRAPDVERADGTGSITGEVIDGSGAPIPGAVVIAHSVSLFSSSDPADVGAGPPVEQGLEEYLRERARTWAASRGSRRRAVTDLAGQFEIEGLLEDEGYSVEAFLEDYVIEAEGPSYGVSPGQRVTFQALGVHVIPVQLSHEDGRQPAEGVIGVKRGDNETFYRWSADAPDLRLTPGRVGVRGYAGLRQAESWRGGADSTHGSEESSVDVVDQAGVPLPLVLKPRCGIRGRVIDDFGAGGGRAVVRLLPMAAGAALDESALAESGQRSYARGDRFHFLDLAPGTYAIGLANRNEALLAHRIVEVGVVEVDLVVPEPDPDQHLVVRTFGPSGNPVQDVDFRWKYSHRGGSSSGGISGRRGRDGVWWLQPKKAFFEPWPEETGYQLTVEHSELGNREIQLQEGQREVSVTFEEPASIVVVVAGYAGSRYVGQLQVHLAPAAGEDDGPPYWAMSSRRGSGEGAFSADGVARFDGLAPGGWEVHLLVKVGEWETQSVQSVEVQVPSGERTVSMSLPTLYDLVVVAPGLSEDTWLHLRKNDEDAEAFSFASSRSGSVGADGRAVFENLTAGQYTLNANGVPEPVEVTVPCGDVYLEAREPDCLRVANGDMEGALYQAGLRAGDLIIGADGEEFASASSVWELFQGEGEVNLIVLRGGERLEFTMKRFAIGSDWWGKLGGMLTPATRP